MKFNKIEQIAEMHNINLLKIYQQAINEHTNKTSLKESVTTDEAINWLTKESIAKNYMFIPFIARDLKHYNTTLQSILTVGFQLDNLLDALAYSKQTSIKIFTYFISKICNNPRIDKYVDKPGASLKDYEVLQSIIYHWFGEFIDNRHVTFDRDMFIKFLLDVLNKAKTDKTLEKIFKSAKLKTNANIVAAELQEGFNSADGDKIFDSVANALYPVCAKNAGKWLIKYFSTYIASDGIHAVENLKNEIGTIVNEYNVQHEQDESFFDYVARKNANTVSDRIVKSSPESNLFDMPSQNWHFADKDKSLHCDVCLLARSSQFDIYICKKRVSRLQLKNKSYYKHDVNDTDDDLDN